MRTLFLVVQFFCFLALLAQEPPKSCQQSKATPHSWMTKSMDTDTRSDSVDLLHERIELDLTDVGNETVRGSCTVTLTPKVDGLDSVRLDLIALVVDSVVGPNGPLAFSHPDGLLRVPLGQAYGTEDTLDVTVYYHGEAGIDNSSFGGFYFENGYIYNLGVAFESVPHSYGRAWFPCFDNFVERTSYEFIITSGSDQPAFCNGDLLSTTSLGGGVLRTHWRINETMPSYLASVAVSNYEVVRDTFLSIDGDPIPVTLVARAQDTTQMKNSFVHLKDAFDLFEDRFGAYDWQRIGYVLTPRGAMEHSTSIHYPENIANGNLDYERIMAHELAHHWFGNKATCERAEEMYLNEGFSEYLSYLFEEKLYGEEAYMKLVRENHKTMVQRAHWDDGGLFYALSEVPQEWTYGEHSYNKGADVLHTLRNCMGKENFYQGLRNYMSTYAFTHANSLQLRDALQPYTTADLEAFFANWILQPGWAAFELDSFSAQPQGTGFEVNIHLQQKLRGANEFYTQVPLSFTCVGSGGEVHRDTLIVGGELPQVTLLCPFAPVDVWLNDDDRLALAQTGLTDTITETGFADFNELANMVLDVEVYSAPSVLRVEQYWVPPDGELEEPYAYVLSPDRYWRVRGQIAPGTVMDGRLIFDGQEGAGNFLDIGLVQNSGTVAFHEDSVVLLHRSHAGEPWAAVPGTSVSTLGSATNGYGRIEWSGVLLGDYAFGWRKSAVGIGERKTDPVGTTLRPNPARSTTTVDLGTEPTTNTWLTVSGAGKVVLRKRCTSRLVDLDTSEWASGQYTVEVLANGHRSGSANLHVVH
jgi:Peptidase family M1 domain/Peptidase M1 N-terminal domain